VIRERLNGLLRNLRSEIGDIEGRGFVDSAPVLERSWAQRSGLGWVGRNGNLIHKGAGSYYFLATLITDLDLVPDDPFAKDFCGTCRRCIDACPTEAILPDKVVDGSRCISYFTIELKERLIPPEMEGRFDDWMFGCDVCQEVCPWNRFAEPTHEKAFQPLPEILNFSTGDWESLSEDAFRKVFRDSPLKRAKHDGIMRNLRFIRKAEGRNEG
jgi:epoxyqueuosine reductase